MEDRSPPLLCTSFLKGRLVPFLIMSLFPYEDVLTKEIESWKGFADRLPAEEDRKVFMPLLNNCYNAKGRPFPTESVIMALLFSQHKLIE